MIYSRSYSRLFIDLKQDRGDFCYDLRPAMGRCIIEIRNNSGKLMIFAQGLKPGVLYRIILVKAEADGSVGINAGLINIDDRGKGNLSIGFDPDDVLLSGATIESIAAILIIVDGIDEIAAPLVGFTGENFVWKNNFKILHNTNKTEYENNKTNSAKDSEITSEAFNCEEQKEDEQDFKNNLSSDEKPDNLLSPDDCKTEKDTSDDVKDEKFKLTDKNGKIADFDSFLEKFRQNMLELEHYALMTEADKPIVRGKGIHGIDYIKNYNKKIKPFENWESDVQWYKILPCELTSVSSKLWRHLNSPFINGCFKKYKHLILGVKNDGEYIIGVPEIYDESFSDEAKKQGFDRFMPKSCKKLENGDMGYWLLDVD